MSSNQQQIYAELIEQSPDPIITVDLVGIIRFVNSAAEEASAYRADELVGKHFTRTGVLTAAGTVKAVQEFTLLVAGHVRPPFELEIVRKDQNLWIFEAHPRLVRVKAGGPATIQVIFRDITNRKELKETLRKQSAALEELKREINALLQELHRAPKYPV